MFYSNSKFLSRLLQSERFQNKKPKWKKEPISWYSSRFLKLNWNSKALSVPCLRILKMNQYNIRGTVKKLRLISCGRTNLKNTQSFWSKSMNNSYDTIHLNPFVMNVYALLVKVFRKCETCFVSFPFQKNRLDYAKDTTLSSW